MAEQKENFVRVTRAAARKRALEAEAATMAAQPARKKRVMLGELRNLSNAIESPISVLPEKPKGRPKRKPEKKATIVDESTSAGGSDSRGSEGDDPQICEAYAGDIHQYLHSMQMDPKRRPLPNYIEVVQKDVTANMRGILVDWLVEVSEEYKLVPDTLYFTVSYIDRFLSYNATNRKYEEISPPHAEDFCCITDNTYTKDEVVKMKKEICSF